jgi:hypothetical protein
LFDASMRLERAQDSARRQVLLLNSVRTMQQMLKAGRLPRV